MFSKLNEEKLRLKHGLHCCIIAQESTSKWQRRTFFEKDISIPKNDKEDNKILWFHLNWFTFQITFFLHLFIQVQLLLLYFGPRKNDQQKIKYIK